MFLDLDKKNINAIALIGENNESLTYGEIINKCTDFKHHVQHRTLVFIFADNSIASILGYLITVSNNIVPLIIGRNTSKELYTRLLNIYKPEYVWIPNDIIADMPNLTDIVYTYQSYVLGKLNNAPFTMHKDLSLLLPTSGSTGSPKLVRHSYINLKENAKNVSTFFNIQNTDRAITSLPMHYTMGLSLITSHLYAGASLYVTNASLIDKRFWDAMTKEHITVLTGVPFSFEILKRIHFFEKKLPDLKVITQGGGKMDDNLFRELVNYAQRNNKKFIATYGQTECTARMTYLPFEFASSKIGSIGIAEPNTQLSLIDDQGIESFIGEGRGELIFRGKNVTMGYADSIEDLSKSDENNGIIHTGDIAYRDSDGFYFIIGRKKRFLKIYGLRISLDEIEYLIRNKFHVDCFCKGTDDILEIYVTQEKHIEEIVEYVIQNTKLFHKNIRISTVEYIKRNEAGKIMFNK